MTYSKNLVYNNMTVNFNNIRIERADADSRDHICYLLDTAKLRVFFEKTSVVSVKNA